MDSAEKDRVQRKSKNGSKTYSWLKMQEKKWVFTLFEGKKKKIKQTYKCCCWNLDSKKQCMSSTHERRIFTLNEIKSKQWRPSHLFPCVTTGLVTELHQSLGSLFFHMFTAPSESHLPLHLLLCYLGFTVA